MRRLLLAALLVLAVPSAAEAKPFTVGTGQNAGVAIDDAGTLYVGWQINTYEPGDAVQFCVLAPRRTRCAWQVTIPFPGQGYNRSRVSVLLPAPGVVDVLVPRTDAGPDAYTFLARSTDGGRTFAPAVQISGDAYAAAVQGPGGRIALVDGPTTLRAGVFAPDGSSRGSEGVAIGDFLEGVSNDIAASGEEVLAAGSDANATHAFRLPAGGNPDDPAAWQQFDPAVGRQPRLAPLGAGGFAVLLEPVSDRPLFVQRLEAGGWSPPVGVAPGLNTDFDLAGNSAGRLSAVVAYSRYRLDYATSTDGGVLWSSLVTVARLGEDYPSALEVATNTRGQGAAVVDSSLDDKAIRVARFTPRAAPVARRQIRGARVQVRSSCDEEELSLVVEAARGNRQVAPSSVLRRARFGRARGARRGFRTRFRARYELTRRRARIPVRVVPRRGKARTLRLRVRRCGATS